LLDRLRSDNDYFLGNGNRSEKHLWAGNVYAKIKEMKRLWNNLPEDAKPEWLSMDDILEYEQKMKKQYADGGFMNNVYADGGRVSNEDYEQRLQYLKMMKNNEPTDLGKYRIDKEIREINTILNHRGNLKNSYAKGGTLDIVDLYDEYYVKGYENKAYQFAYVPEFSRKESIVAYSLGLADGDKKIKKDYESFEKAMSKGGEKNNNPKYILKADIKTVTL
jgi:hypothetical protein